jgi:hypothetical protein
MNGWMDGWVDGFNIHSRSRGWLGRASCGRGPAGQAGWARGAGRPASHAAGARTGMHGAARACASTRARTSALVRCSGGTGRAVQACEGGCAEHIRALRRRPRTPHRCCSSSSSRCSRPHAGRHSRARTHVRAHVHAHVRTHAPTHTCAPTPLPHRCCSAASALSRCSGSYRSMPCSRPGFIGFWGFREFLKPWNPKP